jgi:hypothetical protein
MEENIVPVRIYDLDVLFEIALSFLMAKILFSDF